MKRMLLLVLLVPLLPGCQRGSGDGYCEELSRYGPSGIKLADDEQRCEEILAFAARTKAIYGLEFSTWFEEVFAQRSALIIASITALTDGRFEDNSLPFYPQLIPCGGLALDDAAWAESPLATILPQKPMKLYVSLNIEVSGDKATIRVRQDFDCDGTLGVTENSGVFLRGVPALNGGWKPIATTAAEIDE